MDYHIEFKKQNMDWLERFINHFRINKTSLESMFNEVVLSNKFLKDHFSTSSVNFKCLYSVFSCYLNHSGRPFNLNDFNDYLHKVFSNLNLVRNSNQ